MTEERGGAAERGGGATRTRRAPPPFVPAEVRRTEAVGPRLVRVTLAGEGLAGLVIDEPAASVRVLLPAGGGNGELILPGWDGNRFVLADGSGPTIRTFTPRHLRTAEAELDFDVVVHGAGLAAVWATGARPGWRAAVSGPARGYAVDPDATRFLLAGDETAIPAISQILERLPAPATAEVHVEVASADGEIELPQAPGASIHWHVLPGGEPPGRAMLDAVTAAMPTDPGPGTRVWAAGEAAAVQRLRRHLFETLGLDRAVATVRGYWKHGRSGDAGTER